ncbi:MAG TPA: GNAT family N-acetyltransferase [Thermoleophilaceae bacterium]|nr:GNAT family N-acetyltransferase [Thermoleophilaceae bacterium]
MPGLQRLDVALSDGEVALREWRAADVEAIVEPLNDPAIARWTRVPSPYTREDAVEFLARVDAGRATGEALSLAMVAPATGALVGSIALHVVSWEYRRGNIGYLVFPAARGRGLAPRAVRLLARWAFERADLARVGILTRVGNDASQRVAEKAGFTREGVLRAYMDEDMVSWSLVPADLS